MLPRLCNISKRNVNPCLVFFSKFNTQVELPPSSSSYINVEGQDIRDFKESETQPKEKKIPVITCKRSEFNFYNGQTFPKFSPLPLASSGWHSKKSKGDYFTIHPIIEETPKPKKVNVSFKDLGLSDELVSNLKKYLNIETPTTIQVKGIPEILHYQNTKLTAETGCGKTLAYLLPLVNQVLQWKGAVDRKFNHPLALIITPSRELAIQIGKEAKNLTRDLNVRTKVVLGGSIRKKILNPPVSDVDIIVGTLGALSKHTTLRIYKMKFVRHVILDEADSLFDETFYDKLRHFLRKIAFGPIHNFKSILPKYSQLTLVSATMPQFVEEILEDIVDPSSLVEVATEKVHRVYVPQKFLRLGVQQKPMTLLRLIKNKASNKIPIIIFCNDSTTCEWLTRFLDEFNVRNVQLTGQMSVLSRKGKFKSFQIGEYNVLCTTDAGSRGLDTVMVKDVINYDFPLQTSEYIHRCGRTGRVGSPKDCRVVNFIARPLEILLAQKIEKAVRMDKSVPLCDYLKRNWTLDEKDEKKFEMEHSRQKRNIKGEFEKSSGDSSEDSFEDSSESEDEFEDVVKNRRN